MGIEDLSVKALRTALRMLESRRSDLLISTSHTDLTVARLLEEGHPTPDAAFNAYRRRVEDLERVKKETDLIQELLETREYLEAVGEFPQGGEIF